MKCSTTRSTITVQCPNCQHEGPASENFSDNALDARCAITYSRCLDTFAWRAPGVGSPCGRCRRCSTAKSSASSATSRSEPARS